ncbi:MAG: UDP-N-acetylenolpyruvoylglucosamine reductase [Bacteroidetes bacterium]|nr:UDP-N-acetylenolpyruvoylglucosamine reductase [Bacteroidota bacterium]
MLSVRENISLLPYNTFGIDAFARWMAFPRSTEEIKELLDSNKPEWNPKFVLGGGSNVLFTRNYDGLIIHPLIKGIEITQEKNRSVWVRAGCGENWDDFVKWCVEHDLGGLENLSNIPGNVGASPVQNIGAYGVEARDSVDRVELVMLADQKKRTLSARMCRFNYRDSIFKNELKDKCLITHVIFRLTREPVLKTHYPDLEKELDDYPETTIQAIREAIISIRRRKLPDPAETGNAGSFFKNPVVTAQQAHLLKQSHPAMPVYDCGENKAKLSAAWLIEQSHWKGKSKGNVGTHKNQPLVIVNHGGATGTEVVDFARTIQRVVQNHFGILLETEVNIL